MAGSSGGGVFSLPERSLDLPNLAGCFPFLERPPSGQSERDDRFRSRRDLFDQEIQIHGSAQVSHVLAVQALDEITRSDAHLFRGTSLDHVEHEIAEARREPDAILPAGSRMTPEGHGYLRWRSGMGFVDGIVLEDIEGRLIHEGRFAQLRDEHPPLAESPHPVAVESHDEVAPAQPLDVRDRSLL